MSHSVTREMLEETSDEMIGVFASNALREGVVVDAIGECLRRGLKTRRVLMVVDGASFAGRIEEALRSVGVPMQRISALHPAKTSIEGGVARTPRGQVVVADGEAIDAIVSGRPAEMRGTTDAIMEIARQSRLGSNEDHMLMISREEALLDALGVMTLLIKRMEDADLIDKAGGADRLSPAMRRMMPWLPEAACRPSTTDVARQTMILHREELVDQSSSLSDGQQERVMDSLFGDEAIARERAARHSYVLTCDDSFERDHHVVMMGLEDDTKGFNHRSVNDAWNHRNGRTSGGDRRRNRGGPGRR